MDEYDCSNETRTERLSAADNNICKDDDFSTITDSFYCTKFGYCEYYSCFNCDLVLNYCNSSGNCIAYDSCAGNPTGHEVCFKS